MQVFDRIRGRFLLDWQGAVVRHLFESGHLPAKFRRSGCFVCDKSLVWHLILAGAATRMMLDQIGRLESGLNTVFGKRLSFPARASKLNGGNRRARLETLSNRLDRLDVQLAGPHTLIARMLFARAGHRFSAEDVHSLLLLEGLLLADDRVSSWLGDLVRWSVIRRIEVDGEKVFYDVDATLQLNHPDPTGAKSAYPS